MEGRKRERTLGAQAERLGTNGERNWFEPGRPAIAVVAIYGVMGTIATLACILLGLNPIACAGWLGARGWASVLLSLGLGVILGTTTIAATPTMVRRWRWARDLHSALRPTAHGAGDAALLAVAVSAALAEELLFRGLLVPLLGVVVSSIAFGLLHQIRGRARWARWARWGWVAWATVMGLFFGEVFAMTGSLVGPLLAHAAINHSNLRFLRDNDPAPTRRALGGLLKR